MEGVALLSRHCEVSFLEEALAAAEAGMGASLLLEGGIGTGKSYLLRAALRSARSRGFEAISARARQSERAVPHSLMYQVRDQLLGALGGKEPPGPANQQDPSADLHHMVATCAAAAPVLIALDDLQWADAPSLRWLGHLMARLEGLPLALLATLGCDFAAPSDLVTRRSGMDSPAAVTSGFHRRTVLQGLNVDSVGYLLASASGTPVDPGAVGACHEATGGNPLLVQALLRELWRTGVSPADLSAGRVAELGPLEVAEELGARFEEASPLAGPVLEAVSIMEAAARIEIVAELVDIDTVSAADVLHEMVRCGVLTAGPDGFGFCHPLVRASFQAGMAPSERARLHAETAKILNADAAPREQIARHLMHSAMIGEPWAGRLLLDAADEALARGALREARICLERGLLEGDPADEPRLLRRLGQIDLADGPDRAVVTLRRTVGRTPEGSEQRAGALLDLVQAVVLTGDVTGAVRIMEAEVAGFERSGTDEETKAGARAMLGLLLSLDGRAPRPAAGGKPAVLSAAPARSWVRHAMAARSALHAHWDGVHRAEALRHARLALHEPVATANEHALVRLVLVLLLDRAGEHDEAVRTCRSLLEAGTTEGSRTVVALAQAIMADCAFRAGRLSECVEAARASMEQGPQSALTEWLGSALARGLLGEALYESGDPEGAHRVLIEEGTADGTPAAVVPGLLFHRGRIHIGAGRTALGLADIEECGRLMKMRGWVNPALYPWRSEAALAHARLGNEAGAQRLVQEELTLARAWGTSRALGTALRAAGLLARGDERVSLLTESVQWLHTAGAELDEARAQRDLGREYLRCRKVRQAREQLRAGIALAERCGAHTLLRELRQDLVEAGARPRRGAETGPGSLTPAERRTALLAAEGLTNKAIANRLFVTRRTVEMHLSRVYRKLSITDRRGLHAMTGGQDPPLVVESCA
ncbi:AAA family ATPase [Streptomyces sp. NBC_01471]|uniref:ATP-binding protein n=1 Tax=Streptomyces sp. NBC_01471 TaxID=2903879 RepID=UPI00352DED9E